MKTYRNHRCKSHHKSESTFLRCAFPTLAWVQGDGHYAVIAWCRTPTVTLWSSATLAQAALTELDALRCGGRCTGRHEIVRIQIATDKEEHRCQKSGQPSSRNAPDGSSAG